MESCPPMLHLLTVFDILFMCRDLVSGTQSEQSHRLSASAVLYAVCSNFFGVLLRHLVLLDTSYVLTTTQVMCTLVFLPLCRNSFLSQTTLPCTLRRPVTVDAPWFVSTARTLSGNTRAGC